MPSTRRKNPLYKVWDNMIQRCTNPNNPEYRNYGGRGITVCARWRSFDSFAVDMGPHPGNGLTLDRKQNERGYYKANCHWVSRKGQARNRRAIKLSPVSAAVIRRRLLAGEKGTTLAREFDVCKQMISHVAVGRCWR